MRIKTQTHNNANESSRIYKENARAFYDQKNLRKQSLIDKKF